jgi:hypothetical protein
MQKKFVLILTAILFVFNLTGQDLQFGVFVNPGISWMKTDLSRIQGDGTRIGVNFGLTADRYFADHYAFATGISIHNTGGVLKYKEGKVLLTNSGQDSLRAGSSVKYNLQYIHIPWALKFKTTEIGYTTFFAQLGLNTMINIRTRASVEDMGINSEAVPEEINLFYMGYHISAGVQYKIVGNTALIGGISYTNGFTDITQESDEKTVMHCFEVRIGVVF